MSCFLSCFSCFIFIFSFCFLVFPRPFTWLWCFLTLLCYSCFHLFSCFFCFLFFPLPFSWLWCFLSLLCFSCVHFFRVSFVFSFFPFLLVKVDFLSEFLLFNSKINVKATIPLSVGEWNERIGNYFPAICCYFPNTAIRFGQQHSCFGSGRGFDLDVPDKVDCATAVVYWICVLGCLVLCISP